MSVVYLESRKLRRASALRLEIAKDEAASLGLAGKKLQESIDRYNEAAKDAPERADYEELLLDVAARTWALIVQRELIGFVHDNQKWVVQQFDVPSAALRLMERARGGR